MVHDRGPRWSPSATTLIVANVVGAIPLALWVAIGVAYGGQPGTEYLALLVAPLLIVSLIVLIADLFFAIRVVRCSTRPRRRIGAAVVAATIGAVLVFSAATTVAAGYERYQRNKSMSLQDARTLVEHCKVDQMNRTDGETHLRLRRADDGWFLRRTDGRNFDALVVAVARAQPRCGTVTLVDDETPLTRRYISMAHATRLLNRCTPNGFYYGDVSASAPGEPVRPGPRIGIVLRASRFKQQIIVTNPAVTTELLPAAESARDRCDDLLVYECSAFGTGGSNTHCAVRP